MENRFIRFFKRNLQAVDIFLISILLFYSLLAGISYPRVKGGMMVVLGNLGIAIIFLASILFYRKTSSQKGRFWLRISSVSLVLFYIYEVSLRLVHVFTPTWKDAAIVRLEQAVFGVQPTLWLQKFISPGLTEWMMFTYLFYFALYPILGANLFFRRSEAHMEDFLFTVATNNVLCNVGYFLYPVANPMFQLGRLYSVPLKGYVFTSIGEFMRAHLMSIGGAMPSGHAAAATIIGLMAYRYHRPTFWFLAPVVISIYISSVYCRFHYLSDIILGIFIGLFVWWTIPFLKKRLGLNPMQAEPRRLH